jgi:hypothetical protein
MAVYLSGFAELAATNRFPACFWISSNIKLYTPEISYLYRLGTN